MTGLRVALPTVPVPSRRRSRLQIGDSGAVAPQRLTEDRQQIDRPDKRLLDRRVSASSGEIFGSDNILVEIVDRQTRPGASHIARPSHRGFSLIHRTTEVERQESSIELRCDGSPRADTETARLPPQPRHD